jgi:hypothetical protein
MPPKKRKRLSKQEHVIAVLAKYGFDKRLLGPTVTALLVEIIVRVLNTAHEYDPHVPRPSRIDEIRSALESKGLLAKIEKAAGKEKLDQALSAIVHASWSHYF